MRSTIDDPGLWSGRSENTHATSSPQGPGPGRGSVQTRCCVPCPFRVSLPSPLCCSHGPQPAHGRRIWPIRPAVLLVTRGDSATHSAPPDGRSAPGSVPGPRTASALRKLSSWRGCGDSSKPVSIRHAPFRGAECWGETDGRGRAADSVGREGLSQAVTLLVSQACGLWGGTFQGWEQRVQRP